MNDLKSTREAFGVALLELAQEGLDIVAVSADTSKSMGVNLLKKEYPERCFNCGIAEQDMMMVSAGLASTGKICFAVSYSVFTSMKALEQLRTFICYPNLNVKVIAGLGGFSAGIEGVTHMALEDLGIIRCIPNIVIINPADYYSTIIMTKKIAKLKKPVYMRLGRDPTPIIFNNNYKFEIGKSNLIVNAGKDIGIISCGIILTEVLEAVKELINMGVKLKLLELSTLKPIDEEAIINIAKSTKKLVTIEEHNIIGGLYSAVSEVLCKNYPKQIYPIAVPDRFTESGLPKDLLKKYKLDCKSLISKILTI